MWNLKEVEHSRAVNGDYQELGDWRGILLRYWSKYTELQLGGISSRSLLYNLIAIVNNNVLYF
jgi:hypothetical protein